MLLGIPVLPSRDARAAAGTVIPVYTLDRVLRTIATMLLGVSLGVLLVDPEPYTEGNVVRLDDRVFALVVSYGYRSPITSVVDRAGYDIQREEYSQDPFESSIRAMSAARAMLGKKNRPSLMLEPVRDRAGWRAGLRPGDLVVGIEPGPLCNDGKSTDTLRDRWDTLQRCSGTVSFIRTGEHLQLTIGPGDTLAVETTLLDGSRAGALTPRLKSSSGTSAGLALALLYVDRLSPGDLFSADVVAATGSIATSTSVVLPIGGLVYKSEAAAQEGATLLIVPKGQKSEVDPVLGLDIIEVETVEEAVHALCERGAGDAVCQAPSPPDRRSERQGGA